MLANIDSYWSIYYLTELHLVIFFLPVHLQLGLANCCWVTVFCGSLLAHSHAHSLLRIVYCRFHAIMAETIESLKPTIFTIWSFVKNVS